MTDPLRDRDVAAIVAYRDGASTAVLDVLRMDGRSDVAHALVMERAYRGDQDKQRPYTAVIVEFLAAQG